MKKTFFLTAFLCLLAISALAQAKKTDYSGTWELDVAKSKLDERMRVESMTLTVAQTDKDIKVDSQTKRAPRPEGAPPMGGGGGQGNGQPGGGMPGGQMGGGGRGGMRGGFGGDMSATYTLDGKETSMTADGQMGGTVSLKADLEKDGKLMLTSNRTVTTPMGEVKISTKENWSLSADGKMLTIKRDQTTPRGDVSSELVFTKK